jgi:23S rRNA-/tRNA-specific pseudouridylate synthase
VLEHFCQKGPWDNTEQAPQRFVITLAPVGQRLDYVLAKLISATRSHVKSLIERQRVQVGGEWEKKGYLVRAREQVRVIPLEPVIAVPQEIPFDRKKMAVRTKRRRPAVSRYTAVAESPGAFLVRPVPETGRTHQLRVHLATIGHPIVGDSIYRARRGMKNASPIVSQSPRQALRTAVIRFGHLSRKR